jgi:hypothetical protein
VLDRFVVEADRKVIGVAIRVRGGFRFVCSDPDFRSLDKKIFPRAKALASRVAELVRLKRERAEPVTLH